MSKFKVPPWVSPIWPQKCVICGHNTNRTHKTHGFALRGLDYRVIFLRIKYDTGALVYPICLKHKILVQIARFIYFISFTLIIITIFPSIDSQINSEVAMARLILFLSIVSFLISVKMQPVRVINVGGPFTTIAIRNENYANEFAFVNKLEKITEVPFQQFTGLFGKNAGWKRRSEGVRRLTLLLSGISVISWVAWFGVITSGFSFSAFSIWMIFFSGVFIVYLIPQLLGSILYWIFDGFKKDKEIQQDK